jgi:hypothetical protein
MSEQPTLSPRDGLRFILIRYDHGAMAPGVFAVAKNYSDICLGFSTSIGRASVIALGSTSVCWENRTALHTTQIGNPWASWTRMPVAAVRH